VGAPPRTDRDQLAVICVTEVHFALSALVSPSLPGSATGQPRQRRSRRRRRSQAWQRGAICAVQRPICSRVRGHHPL